MQMPRLKLEPLFIELDALQTETSLRLAIPVMPDFIAHDGMVTEKQQESVVPGRVPAMPAFVRVVGLRGLGVEFWEGWFGFGVALD